MKQKYIDDLNLSKEGRDEVILEKAVSRREKFSNNDKVQLLQINFISI